MRSFSDEDNVANLKEFEKPYTHVEKDKLVLYAVDLLEKEKIEATFEKISVAVFKLFPKTFQLVGFPQYPDGRTIYYSVYNHCTLTKKWLGGNIKSGFFVTEKGRYILNDMWNTKSERKNTIKNEGILAPMRKEGHFIKKLKSSNAYKNFLEKKAMSIAEIKNAFGLPSTADNDLLQAYIKRYESYGELLNDQHVLLFIKEIKNTLEEQ